MYHSLYEYSKAYQAELIRSVTRSIPYNRKSEFHSSLLRRSLDFLGDNLIALGLRIKSRSCCEGELLRSRA
jgi:hypothetical protein